jgi:hypothetical protein
MDGIGLGPNDPEVNPFALADMPNLSKAINGHKLVAEDHNGSGIISKNKDATFLALDATLGVEGHPQSATGQATILTGINIPELLGFHFGPWPNKQIKELLKQYSLFQFLTIQGYRATLLNAYPQSYFDKINTGRSLPGAVAMAVLEAGLPLKTTEDLINGLAISADFTGEGWREQLKIPEIPVLTLFEAGRQITDLALQNDFSFFEYWISDYAGHRADIEESVKLMENFDKVLGSIIQNWDLSKGLIFITSDHGNLENTNTRGHTKNLVPGIVIGEENLRGKFTDSLVDLTGIAPAVKVFFSL